jgi:hypothetical protein
MSLKRRGQGSVEFMMTYGWVLLIILVVLVIMWQWGLFNLSQRVEPGSFGFWGLIVQSGNEFLMQNNGKLQMSVLNTQGANVTLISCNVTLGRFSSKRICGTSGGCGFNTPSDCVIPTNRVKVVEMQDSVNWSDSEGKRFEATVVFTYNDTRVPMEMFQSSGRIWGNIELPPG